MTDILHKMIFSAYSTICCGSYLTVSTGTLLIELTTPLFMCIVASLVAVKGPIAAI
jgi:hypothetical protein